MDTAVKGLQSISSLIPVPGLSTCLSILSAVFEVLEEIEKVGTLQQQCTRLAERAADVLITLNDGLKPIPPDHISDEVNRLLRSLESLLEQILAFYQQLCSTNFLKKIFNLDKLEAKLVGLTSQLEGIFTEVQLALHLTQIGNFANWQLQNAQDRQADRAAIDKALLNLLQNDHTILNAIGLKHDEYLSSLASLEKRLAHHVENSIQKTFMSNVAKWLRGASGEAAVNKMQISTWSIECMEVDMEEQIGAGGFATVSKGLWLGHTRVAIKRLHPVSTPDLLKKDFLREVETWYPLRHANVLLLYGACINTEQPFMVSPYMPNGTILDYLQNLRITDETDLLSIRTRILYHVSCGMQFLHDRHVTHGDLKGVNVLIDDSGNAVIADFGMAQMKQIVSSRGTMKHSTLDAKSPRGGTLRWMAPERMQGKAVSRASDMYSFGMTMYEVFSGGDVPFPHLDESLVAMNVIQFKTRPERPEEGCPDPIWDIMERGWEDGAEDRPSFAIASINLQAFLNRLKISTPRKESSDEPLNNGQTSALRDIGPRWDSGFASSSPATPRQSQKLESLPSPPLSLPSSPQSTSSPDPQPPAPASIPAEDDNLLLESLSLSSKDENAKNQAAPALEGVWKELVRDAPESLHSAVENGHVEAVKMLLKEGADVDAVIEGCTALHRAANEGHVEIAKVLLESGAKVDAKSSERAPSAGFRRHRQGGAKMGPMKFDEATPLHLAAWRGHLELVRVLLAFKPLLNERTSSNQWGTPLYLAVANAHLDVTKLLLENGANVNVGNVDHETPFYRAANDGRADVTALLLSYGANVNGHPEAYETPLHAAVRGGHVEVIKILLEKGAKVNRLGTYRTSGPPSIFTDHHFQNGNTFTPLHLAAYHNRHIITQLLLEHGATIDVTDKYNDEPLHWAAYRGHIDVVRVLADKGAPLNTKNTNGRTPFDAALRKGHKNIAKLLVEKGADVGLLKRMKYA
ncbi:hypothetical protein HK097_006057 [Rhizophlyctis rosea]|uniref:Protein kinase domain-containing protein n=1 Tax=Rhizophlyctis rosea TaxID=64517 RepID=A0AAD5SG17_9FUNG|nr:hypothetical protein HK097_006057 [Rhizophlyctis rosea]